MKTRRLTTDAMLAAMCAVLGYLSVDLGNLKISFESLPVLMAALLFGALDGFAVGGIGTLIYQILRYGVSATTLLWMAPYMVCGLVAGAYANRRDCSLSRRQTIFIMIIGELVILVLNTVALVVDSKIYGYYSPGFVFGTFWIRLALSIGRAVAFGVLVPALFPPIQKYIAKGD